ncbi:relaxase domain-containing protein [Roseateles sp. BYS78W]|uniref:Relaxase domain-containing protein n=1 Tax=Pelomonas candidula TaxID=3299025 RepID=A0ABW7HEZ3_9BURK
MVSYPRPVTRAKALGYFIKESQGYNAFTEHPEFRPEFGGSLLPRLGLKPGPFTEDEYTDFILGEFPAVQSGDLAIAYASDSERAAYDVTVTLPKDFSLQLLVSEDRRLFEVARELNREVMKLFEQYAIVRVTDRNGRVQKLRVEGIAYATWWHISTRERKPDAERDINTGGDPHFHPHNIVSKFVLPRGSSELLGMVGKDIQIARRALNAVDDGAMARKLRNLTRKRA